MRLRTWNSAARRLTVGATITAVVLSLLPAIGLTPTASASATTINGAKYRFNWTQRMDDTSGKMDQDFTSSEIAELKQNDNFVFIAKTHWDGKFENIDTTAQEIQDASGPGKVVLNLLATTVIPNWLNSEGWKDIFAANTNWYLHTDAWMANPDPSTEVDNRLWTLNPDGTPKLHLVNLADPTFRQFLCDQITARLDATDGVYSAVLFDNFIPYNDIVPAETDAPGQISGLNEGLGDLLQDVKATLQTWDAANDPDGPARSVYFNSISTYPAGASPDPRDDTGREYLQYADGADDEAFCYRDTQTTPDGNGNPVGDPYVPADTLWSDIGTYNGFHADGKTVFHLVKMRDPEDQINEVQIKRYCFGVFMMDYTLSQSYILFKTAEAQSGTADEIGDNDTPQEHLAMGEPTADPVQESTGVFARTFDNGCVFANPTTEAQVITPDSSCGSLVDSPSTTDNGDGTDSVPAHDSAYFLN